MPGALFSRIKTWVSTEDVTYSDLNAEFDNILANLIPNYIDDYSANVAQMQTTVDPGEVGSEILATTLAGELQRLRHLIKEITGEDEWYESPVSSVLGLANAIGTGLTDNRLVSGLVISGSQQPGFLIANGAARTIRCSGTTTNFRYYIAGVEYVISTDVTLTGLTAAPSSNNTCLINDTIAADQNWTKTQGENGTEIPVDTMGTEISGLVGKFAAFKLDNGSTTEYFTAYVESSTRLSKVKRGYFFDSTNAAIPRIVYSNNDTITLMKLTWIFAKSDGTLTATYNNPVWSDDEPSSPSIGDYWFDYSANIWKVYGVGSYSAAGAILIGVCIQDTTNTVAARSLEFFANYTTLNTVEIIYDSATQVKSRFQGSTINVWGTVVKNDHSLHTWDITLDRDSDVSESASTHYYMYITETGDKVISDVEPYDRRVDLFGYYHPHKSWRCVGLAFNNASSNLEQVDSYYKTLPAETIKSTIATDFLSVKDRIILLSGASFTEYLPTAALCKGSIFTFIHNGTSLTQVYTLDAFGTETIGGATTVKLHTNGQRLEIISDGTNWIILATKTLTDWVSWTPTGAFTNTTYTGFYKRNGSCCDFNIQATCTGAPGAATFSVDLVNMTIDTAKLTGTSTSNNNFLSTVTIYDATGSTYKGNVLYNNTTSFRVGTDGGFSANNIVVLTNSNVFTFAINDFIDIKMSNVPIVDWII